MKIICKFILKLIGWKWSGIKDIPDKCVFCVAPHTSNWDLPLGLVIYNAMGKKASFLIKKDWFFFPMNIIFNVLGGIPVDRRKKTSLTEQVAEIFNSKKKFQLAITPEGTRKANAEWKKGFYYIALEAKVPIVIVALDYKKKDVEFKNIFVPTGNFNEDMNVIKDNFREVTARFPDQFLL